ncbi:hypothetical protein [Vibrio sp. ABG19]|uniref:hypothetical protein n=1 Tax=Vibrio sp. ABG19 TaxID=2817385 RepID=UPI00249EC269|nr:hypothetical protein [Vibrio sp. ABG19]WGY45252.1 hypothetical protein J0X00_06045 [Vibrio sp. ABG19]
MNTETLNNEQGTQEPVVSMPDAISALAIAVDNKLPHAALAPLVQQLSESWNHECDESDRLFDAFEAVQGKLDKVTAERDHLSGRANMWQTQAKLHSGNHQRAEALLRNVRTDLDIEKKAHAKTKQALAVEEKDHKRAKDQVKRLKASSEKFQTRAASLEKATIELRADAKVANDKAKMLQRDKMELINDLARYKMVTVWAENGEALLVFPTRLTISIEGQKRPNKAFTLLYTDSRGIWRQVAIDADHRVSFSKFAYCEETAKSTTDAANRALLKPSNHAVAVAERWLYKVNVVQHGVLGEEDLDIRNTAEYLKMIGEQQESA